ncbi:PREDICTED: uncharacterized aarF domain-containing protein kinase 1 [Nicrophorus vespilloides]|uniref:Uncharacterized aarF domain-containing protein kinase 1 n=1 Tax=Nicrophorus vespilloides TaxID=110193 RepID=A0ABM1MDD8_NICVS|nr:PREDICTED: uncharacterized aarF domain-containing protein kinase 1 [Nicrophorus vespilloides]
MLSTRTSRLLKYGSVVAASGSVLYALNNSNNTLDSIGVVRLGRAAFTVFKIGAIYKRNLYKHDLDKESTEYKDLKSYCHLQGAENLLDLCCKNKGVYIKVGQHVAALEYLLPKEYVQTMKVLHSHAPPNNIDDVYKVIREDLKADPKEIFAEFDIEPLGTASLAQVHKAKLHDGTTVAVKVQHPYVQGNSRVDMKTMEILVKVVSWVFPEFKFQWLVDETKKNIPQELDFELEGRNAEKVARMFSHLPWLKIPNIRWDYTTSRVLTMGYVEGGQVNDLKYINENKISAYEISDKLGRLYSHMIFINGFVHSDPHPGNILVRKNEQGNCDIVLLDHGLYANLSRHTMIEYANLWLSILDRDRKAMRQHCKNLGVEGNLYGLFACMITGRTWDSIMSGIEKKKPTSGEKDLFQKEFPNLLPDISGVLDRVNRELLLILKTNDLMRGIEYTLKTGSRQGAFKVMSQCCVKSVYKQRIDEAKTKFNKFTNTIAQFWMLFKLNIYYSYITLRSLAQSN